MGEGAGLTHGRLTGHMTTGRKTGKWAGSQLSQWQRVLLGGFRLLFQVLHRLALLQGGSTLCLALWLCPHLHRLALRLAVGGQWEASRGRRRRRRDRDEQ